VHHAPEQPAKEAGELEPTELHHRGAAADGGEIAQVAITKWRWRGPARDSRGDEPADIAAHLLRGRRGAGNAGLRECSSAMKAALGIFLAIMAGGGANAGPDGKEVPRVAFLGCEFINTSLEATARVEVERIRLLDDVLRQKLTASSRFEIVDIPPDTIKEIASGPTISNCNGCQRRFAQMVGANWAAWGTVQKVSNLILNINVYMEDAEPGKMKFARSVDIRGNTDESWRRGLDYLLRNYLLREP